MKLIPTSTRVRRDDQFGRGMDVVFTLVLFLGVGYLVDRWLGTTPLFMIVLVMIGSIGLFVSLKYRYESTMQQLEERRRDGRVPPRGPEAHRREREGGRG
jgi:F0F1-type ATP synthase assembly protein I